MSSADPFGYILTPPAYSPADSTDLNFRTVPDYGVIPKCSFCHKPLKRGSNHWYIVSNSFPYWWCYSCIKTLASTTPTTADLQNVK